MQQRNRTRAADSSLWRTSSTTIASSSTLCTPCRTGATPLANAAILFATPPPPVPDDGRPGFGAGLALSVMGGGNAPSPVPSTYERASRHRGLNKCQDQIEVHFMYAVHGDGACAVLTCISRMHRLVMQVHAARCAACRKSPPGRASTARRTMITGSDQSPRPCGHATQWCLVRSRRPCRFVVHPSR
jgi:hypothetical protein